MTFCMQYVSNVSIDTLWQFGHARARISFCGSAGFGEMRLGLITVVYSWYALERLGHAGSRTARSRVFVPNSLLHSIFSVHGGCRRYSRQVVEPWHCDPTEIPSGSRILVRYGHAVIVTAVSERICRTGAMSDFSTCTECFATYLRDGSVSRWCARSQNRSEMAHGDAPSVAKSLRASNAQMTCVDASGRAVIAP